MNGKCHFVFGAATAASATMIIGPSIPGGILLISTCLLGSQFPDIDRADSGIRKKTAPVSTALAKILKKTGYSGFVHRGIFHDIALYLIGVLISWYFTQYLLGFFIGCVSHTLLDGFTPFGVPVFFGKGQLRIAKFDGNDIPALILTWVISILMIGITIWYRYL